MQHSCHVKMAWCSPPFLRLWFHVLAFPFGFHPHRLLPDGHAGLDLPQVPAAEIEAFRAVSCLHADHNARLPGRHETQPVLNFHPMRGSSACARWQRRSSSRSAMGRYALYSIPEMARPSSSPRTVPKNCTSAPSPSANVVEVQAMGFSERMMANVGTGKRRHAFPFGKPRSELLDLNDGGGAAPAHPCPA